MRNKKSRKELEDTIKILERQRFLDVYTNFDNWLSSLGFRTGHYWTESSTSMDCHYSHYDKHIDSLYSVEHYIHDTVNLSIRFLRDRYEHKFMFVGKIGDHSKVYSVDEIKEIIVTEVKFLRDKQLKQLSSIMNL